MADSIPQRTISDFKGKLTGGGVRPNLFEVQVNFPDNIDQAIQGGSEFNGETFRFMCKASSLPASNVASIEIPFRGRLLKVAGDRTIDPWTVTIINDENFRFRKVFENWAQNIAQYGDASGLNDPNTYMGSGDVYQLGRAKSGKQGFDSGAPGDGNTLTPLAQYRFEDIFPTAVSASQLLNKVWDEKKESQ